MKKLILFLFLIGGFTTNAQILTDSTMQVVAYYEIGESYKYAGWQGEYKIEEGDTLLVKEFRTLYEITVKDIQDNQYIMQGVLLDYEVTDENDTMREQYENSFEMFKNLPVMYSLNHFGTFQEIINWEEIQQRLLARLEEEVDKKIALQKDSAGGNSLSREKMLELAQKPFATREDIQNKLWDNFKLLYTYHGGLYNTYDTYPHNVRVKNIITGDDMTATGEFWIEKMYMEDQVVHMQMRLDVKMEDFFSSIIHWLLDLMKDDPEIAALKEEEITTEKIFEHVPFLRNIKNTQTFYHVIETGTGWTLFYQYLQEINLENVETWTVLEFEMQDEDE